MLAGSPLICNEMGEGLVSLFCGRDRSWWNGSNSVLSDVIVLPDISFLFGLGCLVVMDASDRFEL